MRQYLKSLSTHNILGHTPLLYSFWDNSLAVFREQTKYDWLLLHIPAKEDSLSALKQDTLEKAISSYANLLYLLGAEVALTLSWSSQCGLASARL